MSEEHVPAWCTVRGCKQEADYFYDDPHFPYETGYLCRDHYCDLADDEAFVVNSVGKRVVTGKYCCHCPDEDESDCCFICSN